MDRYDDDGDNWDDYEDLDRYDASQNLKFDLYSKPGAQASLGQGESRSFKVTEDSVAIYHKAVKSDHSVTVQRILWVDGWEDSTKTKAMTLIVLKMSFTSLHQDTKIGHFTATLRLRDQKRKGTNHPTPEAWAPFHVVERFNASEAQRRLNTERNASAKVGYSGTEVTAGGKNEGEISWNQVDFDEGHAAEVFRDGKPTGVLWFMKQNPRQEHGVPPEIWVSVLFSRKTNDPYLVKFNMDVHLGTAEEIKNRTKKFFGLKPDETLPFSVKPGKKQVCNGADGKAILDTLGNLENLGSLREGSKLNVRWGPKYQNLVPTPPSQPPHWHGDDQQLTPSGNVQKSAPEPSLTMPILPPNNPAPFAPAAVQVTSTPEISLPQHAQRPAIDQGRKAAENAPPQSLAGGQAPILAAATENVNPSPAPQAAPSPPPPPPALAPSILQPQGSFSAAQPPPVSLPGTFPVGPTQALPVQQGFMMYQALPPLMIGWYTPGAAPSPEWAARIAALEGRLEEAEKRIARQDEALMQLRQKLTDK